MKKYILGALMLASAAGSAQMNYQDSNMIGIFGGINQTDLSTNNFETKAETGWNVGLSVRGNFYNNFDMVYAIQFSENKFSVPTANPLTLQNEDVDYKIQGVKISLMPSYNIIYNHLSIEAGPVLQVNGKLKYKEESADNAIMETLATVKDLEDVSTFNILGAVGITAGVRNVRLNVQYQYGFNNFLSQVEEEGFGKKVKGNLGILSGNLIIYF
ncbi:outer membrane beta-barrel protein [Flavobacterium selenitireducens]|uniref:outer membrane beta-barrel protein n=1 Tax=Flavobacterium selenitireducens TaxID=2722704 RepID=UPI00168A6333|nr:outer membrane beta-barrel protein [Flavobacterium selenitireducens]MBD3583756.1 PorT family protein [Flavobacterium selenitireducens]